MSKYLDQVAAEHQAELEEIKQTVEYRLKLLERMVEFAGASGVRDHEETKLRLPCLPGAAAGRSTGTTNHTLKGSYRMPLKEAEIEKRERKFQNQTAQRREAKRQSSRKAMVENYARQVFLPGRKALPDGGGEETK